MGKLNFIVHRPDENAVISLLCPIEVAVPLSCVLPDPADGDSEGAGRSAGRGFLAELPEFSPRIATELPRGRLANHFEQLYVGCARGIFRHAFALDRQVDRFAAGHLLEKAVAEALVLDEDGSSVKQGLKRIRSIEKETGIAAAAQAAIDFLHEHPSSHQGFIMLARLLNKQKRFEDARRAAEKAKSLAPLEAEPLIGLGLIAMRKKDYSGASVAFAEAINLEPDSARAHLGAAAVKMVDENYEDALALCEKVLDLDPSLERAHELMARINVRRGQPEVAVEELKTLVENNPENKRILKSFARLMRSEDRMDEVLEYLEAKVDDRADGRKSLSTVARVAISAGKPELAVEKYRALATAKRARPSDKIQYISALTQAGDYDTAETQIEALGDRKAYQPIAAKLRGDIANKRKKPEEALKLYKSACRLAGLSSPAEGDLGMGTLEERVIIWKKHSRKALMSIIRERRSKSS